MTPIPSARRLRRRLVLSLRRMSSREECCHATQPDAKVGRTFQWVVLPTRTRVSVSSFDVFEGGRPSDSPTYSPSSFALHATNVSPTMSFLLRKADISMMRRMQW